MIKFLIFLFLLVPGIVNASSFSTTEDLFESTYSNNLIDMAETRVEDFNDKKFLIFRTDYDYYLVSSYEKDISISGNRVTFNNPTIVRVIRVQNGYNYQYVYSDYEESSTTVHLSHIVVSNIDTSYSISSKRYEDFKFYDLVKKLGIFILALLFAMFLLKGRSYL